MSMIAVPVSTDVGKLFRGIDVPGKRDGSNHITMIHMGDEMELKQIIKVLPIVLEITERQVPFTVSCSKIICFEGGKHGFPVVGELESKELVSLRKKLKVALEDGGVKFKDKYPVYKPHITLSYADEKVKDFKISKTEWQVNEIALYCGDAGGGEKLYVSFPFAIKSMKKSASYVNDCVRFWSNKI